MPGNTISSDLISSLQNEASQSEKKKKNGEIGQNEFLQMLVTQLKNQDPMNPMNGDEFAVNPAQFSQLEQLVSINDKLGGKDGSSDSASLASYLGHEVLTDSKKIDVDSGDGGLVRVNLPIDAEDVIVDFMDDSGNVVESASLGAHAKGEQSLQLNDLTVPNGSYNYQVRAITANGGSTKVLGRTGGLVSGFIPGADPKLLIGSKEIAPSDVKAVLAPPTL